MTQNGAFRAKAVDAESQQSRTQDGSHPVYPDFDQLLLSHPYPRSGGSDHSVRVLQWLEKIGEEFFMELPSYRTPCNKTYAILLVEALSRLDREQSDVWDRVTDLMRKDSEFSGL